MSGCPIPYCSTTYGSSKFTLSWHKQLIDWLTWTHNKWSFFHTSIPSYIEYHLICNCRVITNSSQFERHLSEINFEHKRLMLWDTGALYLKKGMKHLNLQWRGVKLIMDLYCSNAVFYQAKMTAGSWCASAC